VLDLVLAAIVLALGVALYDTAGLAPVVLAVLTVALLTAVSGARPGRRGGRRRVARRH
jgi:hypothetical protein